jgi:hypothetical protein
MIFSARVIASEMAHSSAGEGPAVPIRQLPSRKNGRGNQQSPLASLVHSLGATLFAGENRVLQQITIPKDESFGQLARSGEPSAQAAFETRFLAEQ